MTSARSSCSNSMSLIERKKLQWAREREELANLGIQFKYNFDQESCRYRYSSKPLIIEKDHQPPQDDYHRSSRRSSLPPLHKNQFNSNSDFRREKCSNDRGGETSGYGSDTFATPDTGSFPVAPPSSHLGGYESSSSYRDDRPKWGDKGVGVGKYWQPKEITPTRNEPPNWVKRGLEAEGGGAIMVANSSSPSLSPEQRCEDNDRPLTGSSYSHPNQSRSYIRGQNIPIDSIELAERERKRQLAIAHQDAIRQQLEERERQRQEERTRRIMEEKEEEMRIERERENERMRKMQEEKALQEKIEREQKRKDAINEALKVAEEQAKLEKMRLKMLKQNLGTHEERNMTENVIEKDKVSGDGVEVTLNNKRQDVVLQKNENISREINNNLNDSVEEVATPQDTPPMPNSHSSHQLTYFFQPQMDSSQIQYALLIPTAHYPLMVPTERVPSTSRTENRLLTPTRYRNNIPKCDSSTQTDNNLLSADNNNTNKEKIKRAGRRSRSTEERPKWGANRPPTRYMKQSEKDLLYQRRKMRQKREIVTYDSDDSQMGQDTPPLRHSRKCHDKRTSRARWRTDEIIHLATDRDQVYLKCCCNCTCSDRVDILKITDRDEDSRRALLELEQDKWEEPGRSPNTPPNFV
ncbi:hypothetical protein ABEB36_001762 [Hypothenemus hampei]|uniref:CCDC66 domain-containing protein n=1 Tax=Hypothenemus hampei TaxID=57062 RepID=A0ABD1FFN9_HYPHA